MSRVTEILPQVPLAREGTSRYVSKSTQHAQNERLLGSFIEMYGSTRGDYDELLKAYEDKCSEADELQRENAELRARLLALEERGVSIESDELNDLFRLDKMPLSNCKKALHDVVEASKTKKEAIVQLCGAAAYYMNLGALTNGRCAELLNKAQTRWVFTESDVQKARSSKVI